MKKVLVCGAGGFIGSHLVASLKNQGCWVRGIASSEPVWVRGVDIKLPQFSSSFADDFMVGDLRDQAFCEEVFEDYDEVYQLAADMGGAGFIFTGENDADVMHNSAQINLNVADACVKHKVGKVFYSSSACIYPEHNQLDPNTTTTAEETAYPAAPDSEYGWEKLFSERLYLAYSRNYDLDVRIARFHNIFGPEGTYKNGREKAPAAMCRKVAEAANYGNIEVWGDGKQTRSFLYIDECLEAVQRLMDSNFSGPVNIGSDEMISINDLAEMTIDISEKTLGIVNIAGPLGVRGRTSDNNLIESKLGWKPSEPLRHGMEKTYRWIEEQVKQDSIWANL